MPTLWELAPALGHQPGHLQQWWAQQPWAFLAQKRIPSSSEGFSSLLSSRGPGSALRPLLCPILGQLWGWKGLWELQAGPEEAELGVWEPWGGTRPGTPRGTPSWDRSWAGLGTGVGTEPQGALGEGGDGAWAAGGGGITPKVREGLPNLMRDQSQVQGGSLPNSMDHSQI